MENMLISEGMIVRSADGEKLGKVVSREDRGFIVEKGFFFPKDYFVREEDVAGLQDGEIHLRLTADMLREAGSRPGDRETAAGAGDREIRGGEQRPAASMAGASQDVRIPVTEEELVAEKRARQAGEVKVRKEVHTEHRNIDVPVTKEEVHVERVPASGDARPGDSAFQQGTVSVPVHEEEVEIRKRPVVREEVRVSKSARQEERRAEGDVRKESVDVQREGDVSDAEWDKTRREPEE